MKKNFLRSPITWGVLFLISLSLACSAGATAPSLIPTQAPAVAQNVQPAVVPANFCANSDGMVINASAVWPTDDPCQGTAGQYVVTACQTSVGQYEANDFRHVFADYQKAKSTCITGVAWFEPTPAHKHADLSGIKHGICADKPTRKERLQCATDYYFQYGQKLPGIEAYIWSLGGTWDDLYVGDPFQPSADAQNSNSPLIWGAVIKASGLTVTGNSCFVTDQPDIVATYGWYFRDDRYNPKPSVYHVGEGKTVDHFEEVAFNGDCGDWPEIVNAAAQAGYTLLPVQ